jgi:hypothetical protein
MYKHVENDKVAEELSVFVMKFTANWKANLYDRYRPTAEVHHAPIRSPLALQNASSTSTIARRV